MKAKEIRELSDEEMAVELRNLREALFRLRFREVAESARHAPEHRLLRRDIARVLTIMRERRTAGEKDSQ
jgi:large subunit ribosomal protein L29